MGFRDFFRRPSALVGSARSRQSALFDALRRKDGAAVRELVRAGVDVNATEANDAGTEFSILHVAVQNARDRAVVDVIPCLLAAGADVNARTVHNVTPLHIAVSLKLRDVVDLLLAAGADPTAYSPKGLGAPLHEAVRFAPELVEPLLRAGADVNRPHGSSETPLMMAASRSPTTVRALIDAGADVNAVNRLEETALFFCEDARAVESLVAAGAKTDVTDQYGFTPLTKAALMGRSAVGRALIASGADVRTEVPDWMDHAGLTALHCAALRGDLELIRALVDAGASVVARDREGRTACDYATDGHPDFDFGETSKKRSAVASDFLRNLGG